jgi:large subunit ribosomal protein L24
MKQEWSKNWKESIQPRKQRKYRFNAPLHIARNFLAAHLSKDLRKKYGIRAVIARKGDKVKIMRGQFKNKIGTIEDVSITFQKIAVEGATFNARDGKKKPYPIHPSNLMIVELNLDDKKRKASIERASKSKLETKPEIKTEKKATVKQAAQQAAQLTAVKPKESKK